MAAWPGSPDRTAGRTGGKVKPPAGGRLPRLQLRAWGRRGRGGAPGADPPQDLTGQNTDHMDGDVTDSSSQLRRILINAVRYDFFNLNFFRISIQTELDQLLAARVFGVPADVTTTLTFTLKKTSKRLVSKASSARVRLL